MTCDSYSHFPEIIFSEITAANLTVMYIKAAVVGLHMPDTVIANNGPPCSGVSAVFSEI